MKTALRPFPMSREGKAAIYDALRHVMDRVDAGNTPVHFFLEHLRKTALDPLPFALSLLYVPEFEQYLRIWPHSQGAFVMSASQGLLLITNGAITKLKGHNGCMVGDALLYEEKGELDVAGNQLPQKQLWCRHQKIKNCVAINPSGVITDQPIAALVRYSLPRIRERIDLFRPGQEIGEAAIVYEGPLLFNPYQCADGVLFSDSRGWTFSNSEGQVTLVNVSTLGMPHPFGVVIEGEGRLLLVLTTGERRSIFIGWKQISGSFYNDMVSNRIMAHRDGVLINDGETVTLHTLDRGSNVLFQGECLFIKTNTATGHVVVFTSDHGGSLYAVAPSQEPRVLLEGMWPEYFLPHPNGGAIVRDKRGVYLCTPRT